MHEFLTHFKSVKGNGNQYTALCPAHDDKQNSLSIANGDKGVIIRHMSDTGIVSILDFRVRKRQAYRKIVLNSLADCEVTCDIGAVKAFIKTKKPKLYFNN